jgi:hypothetical protein
VGRINQLLPKMLSEFSHKGTPSFDSRVENSIPFLPEIKRCIRFDVECMQFCPFRMRNNPPALTFSKDPETSQRLSENDLIWSYFHDRIHVINELQVKGEDPETDQHPDKINQTQVIFSDSPDDDLIIYAKN